MADTTAVEAQSDHVGRGREFDRRELELARFRGGGIRREYAEIGLSANAGWYSAIGLNFFGGAVLLAFEFATPELMPPGANWYALVVIFNGVLAVAGLRVIGDRDFGLYFRVGQSWIVFVGFAFVMGEARLAFIWIPMLALASVASLYGMRRGVPFVLAAAALVAGLALATDVPGRTELAATMACVMLVVGAALLLVQRHVRGLARVNRRLAETDELTGVANMHTLRLRIAAELEGDSSEPFALFAIDLDDFKRVNDEFTHGIGDRVLRAVARSLCDEVEERDLVARRGGDEFSVVVPDAGNRNLDAMAARFAAAITSARMSACPEVTPSGSVGYTICHPGEQVPDVLARADDALHDAKLVFRKSSGIEITRNAPDAKGFVPSSGASFAVEHASRYVKGHDVRLVWRLATLLFASLGAIVGALAAASIDGAEAPYAAGIAALLLGVAAWCERSHTLTRKTTVLVPLYLLVAGLTAAAAALSGESAIASVQLMPLLALYAFILFRPKIAIAVGAACLAAFVPLVVAADLTYTTVTCVATAFIVAMSASVVAKVRSVTKRFILANVELSERDALTGVANLRALRARLAGAAERGGREDVSLGMVVFDLDDFKAVNERYNHTVGDAVLVAAARAIEESARLDDLVARRGGDEFYVVAERADTGALAAMARRMAAAVSQARMRICPDLVSTASFAVVVRQSGEDASSLMVRADLALHESKVDSHRARELRLSA